MIQFSQVVRVKSVRYSRAGADDAGVVIEVKVEASMLASDADMLVCAGINEGALKASLWLDNGDPTFKTLGAIDVERSFGGMSVRFKSLDVLLEGASISKIKLQAEQGEIALVSMTITAMNPPKRAGDLISTALSENTWVDVWQPQLDMLAEAGGE